MKDIKQQKKMLLAQFIQKKQIICKFVDPFIIKIKQTISKGLLGDVFKGIDTKNKKLIAAKMIPKYKLKKECQTKICEYLSSMAVTLTNVRCQNLVEIYGVKDTIRNIYIFQELCSHTLQDVLLQRKTLPEAQAIIIMRQLIAGYKCLFDLSIIHCHLKPSNIFLSQERYKIGNFCLAQYYQQLTDIQDVYQGLHKGLTPTHVCPEILFGSAYSNESDVWAMGVIFFQMLYGRVPLEAKSLEELISKAKKNEIHFPYQLVTPTLRELLEAMLQCDPKNRISWKEIFALKLFAGKEKVETGLTHTIKSVENNLEAMLKESEMYFDTKKTILEIEMPITVEAPPFEKVQDVQEVQNKLEQRKGVIRAIKNWFILKRNIAVFYHHLLLQIYKCRQQKTLPSHLIEAFMLVLCKQQCIIAYKSYARLKEGKMKSKAFTEQQFKIFLAHNEYTEKLKKQFKVIFQISKLVLDELAKGVKNYIGKGGQLPQELKDIQLICNSQISPKELLSQLQEYTIKQLKQVCRAAISAAPKSREVIELAYLLPRTQNLDNSLIPSIYEQQKRLTDGQLLTRAEYPCPN